MISLKALFGGKGSKFDKGEPLFVCRSMGTFINASVSATQQVENNRVEHAFRSYKIRTTTFGGLKESKLKQKSCP